MKVIVGLDPGTLVTGYGVVEQSGSDIRYIAHGIVKNSSDLALEHRLLKIGTDLQLVFQKYNPSDVVIEKIFLGKNADSAFKLGHARGVAIYEAQKRSARIIEYAAREVKKGITGYGGAEKEQVRQLVCHYLDIPIMKEIDAADALALAIYHTQKLEIERKFSRQAEC